MNEFGDTCDSPEEPDPLKPPLPYTAGAHFTIRRHSPPSPFGGYGYTRPHRRRGVSIRTYPHASSLCLAFPPPPTPPHPDQSSRCLTIVDSIASYDSRGSQLISCYLDEEGDSTQKHQLRVAKIYDPLYYDYCHDVTYLADQHYSYEAAAYNKICEMKIDGAFTPYYYGTLTFKTSLLDGHMREVRMILIEHVPHPSMQSLIDRGLAASMPAHRRMQALTKAVEAYHWFEFWGVRQTDFMPRNVMVSEEGEPVEVFIVDFSHARVRDLPNSTWVWNPATAAERPALPLVAFVQNWGYFEEWVPAEMHSREARLAWRQSQWGGSTIFEPPAPPPLIETRESDEPGNGP